MAGQTICCRFFPLCLSDFTGCRRCCPGDWMPLTKKCYWAKCRYPYTTPTQFTWSFSAENGRLLSLQVETGNKDNKSWFEGERGGWTALILWQLGWAPIKMHHCCLSSPDSLLVSQQCQRSVLCKYTHTQIIIYTHIFYIYMYTNRHTCHTVRTVQLKHSKSSTALTQ